MRLPFPRSVAVVAALVLVALAVRIAWVAWTDPVPPPVSDSTFYHATAQSLARGHGYSVAFRTDFEPGGAATAFWPPGYSAYLAAFYRAFGQEVAVARVANAIAGALVVVPVYFIGRRLFDERAALFGAGIAALLPSLVFWTAVMLSETLFTLLFACSVALLLHSLRPDGSFRVTVVVLAGLSVGIAALVRGQALLLVPIALLWWLACGGRPRAVALSAAVALVAVAAVLGPWAARNARVMDEPVLLSANFGYNLRVGHAPYSTGRYVFPQDLWTARPGISFHDREVLFDDLGTRRAVDYAAGKPLREVELAGQKIVALWRPDSDVLVWVSSFGVTRLPERAWEPLRLLIDVTYAAVLLLAAAAFLRYREYGRGLLFPLLVVAAWTLGHVVFFGEPRYHLPVLAVLAPLAGVTLSHLWPGHALARA